MLKFITIGSQFLTVFVLCSKRAKRVFTTKVPAKIGRTLALSGDEFEFFGDFTRF